MNRANSIQTLLWQPKDTSSLAVFRVGFGLILLWDVVRYWSNGWIDKLYIRPEFHFKYYGFEWIQVWSPEGMYAHFLIMGIAAFFIMLGALYYLSIIVFTLCFAYVFLLDQANYLNHFYMVILFAISLCFIPANRHFSIDAWLRPKIRSHFVPAWSIWLLRVQMEIILLFAGIVKLNPDWLRLEPLAMWLEKRHDFPLLGPLFTQDWSVAIAAYGVIALHIIGAPLLLWKKTRLYVFLIYACFHSLNHFVFNIGIFPWFTLFASLLFFDPDWPKQVWARLRRTHTAQVNIKQAPQISTPLPVQQYSLLLILVVWLGFQVLFPLRHWLYPGNVSWTEQGHRFSWQMKLRDKKGKALFYIRDPATNYTRLINPREYLSRRQYRKMSTRPDMILQFAHYIRDHWTQQLGLQNIQVFAEVYASLNGRKPALLIDPERDLAAVERDLWAADWILPLQEPFRRFTRD